ncbi:hypothetical protein [Microbacterium sp. P02]|uniref:hypothetical protein n=1 Tax=Microbacterium sp. P02 TaxID=3366260 RepID=UPI00366EA91E
MVDRNSEYSKAVTELLASPDFLAHINGRGYSPWVGLEHAVGRRGENVHDAGARVRIGAGNEVTSDVRLAVHVDVPDPEAVRAGRAVLVNVINLDCSVCEGRITVSELDLLRLVVRSLMLDTRGASRRYVARVR